MIPLKPKSLKRLYRNDMRKNIFDHFKKNDPVLHSYAQRVGTINLQKSDDFFIKLCESIINQQLSEKAADTIFCRFKKLLNHKITPSNILKLPDQKFRDCGISFSKISYLKGLSQKIVNKELVLEDLVNLSNDEVIEKLIIIKGIGRWTAEMFLMFSLAREDVFSHGDLGLRRGIEKIYTLKNPNQKKVEKIVKKWHPYETYASIVLWRSMDLKS